MKAQQQNTSKYLITLSTVLLIMNTLSVLSFVHSKPTTKRRKAYKNHEFGINSAKTHENMALLTFSRHPSVLMVLMHLN